MPPVKAERHMRVVQFALLMLVLPLLVAAFQNASVQARQSLTSLPANGSVLLHSPRGETLVSHQPQLALIPASLVKIPLAQVALAALGGNYRYETYFYRSRQGDLLVRGQGDPFLVSEEIADIAAVLARQGVKDVARLVMDDSAFAPDPDLPLETGADDPYAARTSALAVNFNTVSLAWDSNHRLLSGESQTPLTAQAVELGSQLTPGLPQRMNLGEDPLTGLRQAQQLFRFFLEEAGVTVRDNGFYRESAADDWSLLYVHSSSRSLEAILQDMLRYSNNFIANQVFLTLGAQQQGYPATVEAARSRLRELLARLYGDGFGENPEQLFMVEGSGLDREQRITAAGMMQIMEAFLPHAGLLPERNGVLRKSGTLTGVYNLAGYISGADGLYPYVILTNQSINNRDEILQLLIGQVQRKVPPGSADPAGP